jgi:AAA15 family ATPase/GTPase
MLQEIIIERFRCFDQFKVRPFSRINLIGGQNNVGKTSLLEALYLLSSGTVLAALALKQSRQEPGEMIKQMPLEAWHGLFYNQDISIPIRLQGHYQQLSTPGEIRELTLSLENSVESLVALEKLERVENLDKLMDFLNASKVSTLLGTFKKGQETLNTSVVATPRGILNVGDREMPNSLLISSGVRTKSAKLTQEFDLIRLQDREDLVLEILQILDPSLEKIESFNIGEPCLYLKSKNRPRLPLYLFGDAINRVMDIVLKIIHHQSREIFIDEVENGLHYSAQRQFWQGIFKLCDRLDVQLFATTHSLEMIMAFTEAGLSLQADQFAYFELARNPKTQRLVAVHRDLEGLRYTLEVDQGKGVRGE